MNVPATAIGGRYEDRLEGVGGQSGLLQCNERAFVCVDVIYKPT